MRIERIILVLMSLLVPVASGQTAVNFGDDGAEPKTPLNLKGMKHYVMVVVPDAPLRVEWRDSAAQVPYKTVFREVFLVYKEDRSLQYYLIKTDGDRPVWGWIKKTYLLTDTECKRSEDPNNPAFLKVALKNNLQVSLTETVNVYAGPGATNIVEKNGIAQILYVFDQKRGKDGVDYLLVGWDAAWSALRPNDCIRGWVRKDQCTIWNHRIAVYYNRKNRDKRPPVQIFRSIEDLQKAQSSKQTQGLAVETATSHLALTYDRSRFPVLQDTGTVQKIAFIGDPTRPVRVSIAEANEKKNIARNMQVLFIIDGTVSMGKYFEQVQKAVYEYAQSIPTEQERARHHFAVAIYRDYEDGPDGEMEFIAGFDDPTGLARLGSLRERSSHNDHTLEEAVFNGIVRAITTAKWDSGVLKSVVVIGDHPNHRVDPRRYTPQSVVKSLEVFAAKEHLNSGFRFHAINVNIDEKHRNLSDEFINQMKQIGNQFQPAGRFIQVDNANGDMNEFRRAVTDILRKTLRASGQTVEVVSAIQQGKSASEIAATHGTEYLKLAIDILAELGVKPEVIDRSGVKQVSMEGWVQKSSGNERTMEPWVYIDRTELDEFRGFLASLLRGADRRQRASQIIMEAVQRSVGDPRLQETVSSYVKRAFALPFRGDSAVLNKTPDQLQEALGDQNFLIQFRKRIGYSYEVLGLVAQELDPSALRWDELQNKWVRTTPHPGAVKSWVTQNGGQTFCWIPLEFLP